MATAAASKVASRLSTRLYTKLNKKSFPPQLSQLLKPSSVPARPTASRLARLPVELSCVASMVPLHSAIASARMISRLSNGSDSWALVPQGISLPL